MSKILFVGSLSSEATNFLAQVMDGTDIPYKISAFTQNLQLNKAFILQEISYLRPTVIVCLGSASTVLFGTLPDDKINTARKSVLQYGDIPVHTTYNPAYLIKNGGTKSKDFDRWVGDIRSYFNAYSDNHKDTLSEVALIPVERYKEFIGMFSNSEVLALDYETSGLKPLVSGFFLGGIGLADKEKSAYLVICDYANPAGRLEGKIKDTVGKFLEVSVNKKSPLAFNANYEYLVTMSQFQVKMDGLVDVMQMGRTLDRRGDLEALSSTYLGVRGWTRELQAWLELLEQLLPLFKPTMTAKGPRDKKETLLLLDKGAAEAFIAIKAKDLKSTPKLIAAIDSFISMSNSVYGSEEETMRLFTEWVKYKHKVDDWEVKYTDIPYQIIGPYCGADCLNTVKLKDVFWAELESKKLESAFKYYNDQMLFGANAELTGFVWDDKYVTKLKSEYKVRAVDALRNFLLVGRVKKILEVNYVQELEIMSATSIDTLKGIFNPNNNQAENTELLSNLLCSDKVKMAMMFANLNKMAQEEEGLVKSDYPLLWALSNKFRLDLPDYPNQVVKIILEANANSKLTMAERGLLSQFSCYVLPDASSETIESLASSASKYLGVNLEDEDTWSDDYKAVFYYKLFKKIDKVISAFMDGVNGRKSVVLKAPGNDISYKSEYPGEDYEVQEGETFHYVPHYGVNAAVTKRWTSAYHGIPGNSDVKAAFVPHYENGFFLHADFAQNEYKVFAALANEPAIVEAFRQGKDIHRFIASKTFRKPEEEISGSERNVAKRLSFGLLYGKSVAAIAEEYFRGDIVYAQKLFDDFFEMFPNIKIYIEKQKQMLFDLGYITTVFGDPIYIQYDTNKKSSVNDAIRYSGNYPTQSSASSVAALVGADLVRDAGVNNWPIKIPGFIHDCLEGSFASDFFIPAFEIIPDRAERWPFETFGLPMSIDMEVGVRGGPFLVEWKRLKGESKFVNDGVIKSKFEGEVGAVRDLFRRLKSTGHRITIDKYEEEDEYTKWSELYMKVASAYHTRMGCSTRSASGTIMVERA